MRLSKRVAGPPVEGSHVTIDGRAIPATIYVADETKAPTNVRHRNKSSCGDSPTGLTIPPRLSGSPSSFSTPMGYSQRSSSGYSDLKKRADFSHDSGFADHNESFQASSIKKSLTDRAAQIIPDEVKTPLSDLKKKWKRYNSSLYSASPSKASLFSNAKPQEILPLCVVLIVVGSAVFTICALNNAINKSYQKRNFKYGSIEFGHQKTVDKMEALRLDVIMDENGVALGGKKAAIQFGYNLRSKLAAAEGEEVVAPATAKAPDNDQPNEEILNTLTMKVANDVMKLYNSIQAKELDKGSKREMLVKKLGEFGHFGTSVVKPLDIEGIENEGPQEADDDEPIKEEPVDEEPKKVQPKDEAPKKLKPKRAKRDQQGLSAKQNPFKNDQVTKIKAEDDPFRFV